jgi:hypothetical protein
VKQAAEARSKETWVSLKACVLGVVAAAVLVGCGGDVQDGKDGDSVVLSKLSAGDKNCPTGGVRVAAGTEAHYVCNGQSGADGGGAGGSSGFTPDGLLNCSAVTTMPNGTAVYLRYNIVTFSDGSAFVNCSANTTGLVEASTTDWFAPWQVGADSKYCQLGSDAAGAATAGYWDFKSVNGGYRATYHDPGTSVDGWSYAFTAQECPLLKPPA